MPPVAGFAKHGNINERVQGLVESRRTSIDGFPFQIEETGEAPQRLADVHRDILSLTGTVSPQRRDGSGPGGETKRGHRAKPKGAGNNRILAVEGQFAPA